MLKLQFKDRRREAVWLVDHTFTIGKNARNSLMIDDNSVLEFHAELINENDQLTLVDKSAGKGIWVNGQQVTSHIQLKKNDIIRIGAVELVLSDPKAGVSFEPEKTQSKPVEGSWAIHSKASWLEQSKYDISGRVVIGRDPSCDIALPLEHLSRKHVALEVKSGQLHVQDLESSNGTFVNGERITSKTVKPGDKIKLDVVTFDVLGPTSDPNKTIIRTAPLEGVSQQPSQSKKQSPTPPKANGASNGKAKSPAKKKLSAQGKQDWISGQSEPVKKSNAGLIAGIVVVIAIAVVAVALV